MDIGKKTFYLIVIIVVCAGLTPARAASFDGRNVILLPRSNDGGHPRTLDEIKKEQEDAKKKKNANGAKSPISNDNITILPNAASPAGQSAVLLPSNRDTLNNKPLTKNETALNNAYAGHLFSSICSQNYRDEVAPRSEKNLDLKLMWSDIQKSCKCLSDQVLAKIPAAELSDYVMFNYGWQPIDGSNDPEYVEYDKSGRADAISDITSNQLIRKKCGFLN